MKIFSIPLIFPEPTEEFIEQYYPYLEQDMRELSVKEKILKKEEVALMYDQRCNADEPLFSRACITCKLEFDCRDEKMLHLRTYEHEVARCLKHCLPVPENPLICKICDTEFTTKAGKEKHLTSQKHQNKLNGNDTTQTYCFLCDLECASPQNLKNHNGSKMHIKEKARVTKHFCSLCNKTFKRKQNLEYHLTSSKHKEKAGRQGAPDNFCKPCKTQFKNRKQFQKHCRTSKKHCQKCKVLSV